MASDFGLKGRRVRPRAGFTLLELLLVLAILGLVMGVGLGTLASLDLEARETPAVIRNVLRTAQNTAVARRAATRVRIDREARTLSAEISHAVGTWQFEDRSLSGAFGLAGSLDSGGRIAEDGYLGQCLTFRGEGLGAHVEVPLPDGGRFDLSNGFVLDFALRVAGGGGFRVLHVGQACGVDVLANGVLRGWLSPTLPASDRRAESARGSPVTVESSPNALLLDRWVHVRLEYDRLELRLLIDGVEVARTEEGAAVWAVEGPLAISDRESNFEGSIDKLVLSVVERGDPVSLAEGQVFVEGTPALVQFEPGGALSREHHPVPAVIEVESADGRRDRIRVGLYGTVEDEY